MKDPWTPPPLTEIEEKEEKILIENTDIPSNTLRVEINKIKCQYNNIFLQFGFMMNDNKKIDEFINKRPDTNDFNYLNNIKLDKNDFVRLHRKKLDILLIQRQG